MKQGLAALLTSPHLIDVLLLFVAVEAAGLIAWQRTRPESAAVPARVGDIILMLLPGVCLMLAVRAALDGAAWPWVPMALTGSLIAHMADIRNRWRSR